MMRAGCTKRTQAWLHWMSQDLFGIYKGLLAHDLHYRDPFTWRCQLWQLGRNTVSSTEALKKSRSSSLGLVFKPADLKHKGAEGVGNNQAGSSSKRSVPPCHPTRPAAHQQLCRSESARGLSHVSIWMVAEHQIFTEAVKSWKFGSEILPSCWQIREMLTCQKKQCRKSLRLESREDSPLLEVLQSSSGYHCWGSAVCITPAAERCQQPSGIIGVGFLAALTSQTRSNETTAVCNLTFKWQLSVDNKHMVGDCSHADNCSVGGTEPLQMLEDSTALICSWEGHLSDWRLSFVAWLFC